MSSGVLLRPWRQPLGRQRFEHETGIKETDWRGRSNGAGRREREIALQLLERANTVHVIRTDDSPGIEAYWHRRFAEKRRNGEWFELKASGVRAFKRRNFM